MNRRFIVVFLMLGMVSLFADMAYEGGGSVTGSYMEFLGASAIFTGLLGLPEFFSYVARLIGGWAASRSRSSIVYWGLVFLGYITNFSMPLLALAGRPELVFLLVFVERIGKGLRGPVRDVILSEVTEDMGRGKGFGLHEVMDQAGAFIGPLSVAYALYISNNNYQYAFSILTIPVILSLICLSIAAILYPRVEAAAGSVGGRGSLSRVFWIYTFSSSLMMLGFLQWRSILSFYLRDVGVIPDYYIALLYTLAMGVDAIVALPMGLAYDNHGLKVIIVAPLSALLIPSLIISNHLLAYVLAAILWGVFMGAYETIMRAAVADLTEPSNRAYAYGIYSFASGISWMIGTMIMALLLTVYSFGIVVFSLICEVLAITLLVSLWFLRKD
ncbi:MAG: MFS transporter [Candidatus Methanomethylicia archaeon]